MLYCPTSVLSNISIGASNQFINPSFLHVRPSYMNIMYAVILYVNSMQIISGLSYHNFPSQRATVSFEEYLHSMILLKLRFNHCSPIEPCINDNTDA